jgi:uncharacterized protein YndB with AHSA1/START domain
MAIAEDKISLLVPAPRVWKLVTDFTRWKDWLQVPQATTRGLGEDLRLLAGEGIDMRFGLFHGDILMQTMRVAEWDPPRRLVLELEGWNWKALLVAPKRRIKVKVVNRSWLMPDLVLSYAVEVTPASDNESTLCFRAEGSFLHKNWFAAWIFNSVYVFVMRRILRKTAEGFTARFARSL